MSAVDLAVKWFANRTDACASLASWGLPSPIRTMDPGQFTSWVEAHVHGRRVKAGHLGNAGTYVFSPVDRIGLYAFDSIGRCRWLCIDFDGLSHGPGRLEDPLGEADAVMVRAASVGVPSYLERSASGDSWHLWVFFESPQDPKVVRDLAWALLELQPDQEPRKGIDVLPSSDLPPRNLGCMVWLAWWHGAKPGCNQFYRVDGDELVSWMPDAFDPLGDVEGTIVRLRPRYGWAPPLRAPIGLPADEQIALPPPPEIVAPVPPAIVAPAPAVIARPLAPGSPFVVRDTRELWADWKQRALLHLNLADVYGPQGGPFRPTGLDSVLIPDGRGRWQRRSNGWLRARDPRSPTGDRDPSASVADGAGQAEIGTFASFIQHDSIDVLTFLERHRGMSPQEARKHLARLSGVPLPELRSAPLSRHEQQAQREEQRVAPYANPGRRAERIGGEMSEMRDVDAVDSTTGGASPPCPDGPPDDPPPGGGDGDGLPPPPWEMRLRPQIIVTDKQLRELVTEAWDAIMMRPTCDLYMHNGATSTIDPAIDLRPARIRIASARYVRGQMTEAADWFQLRVPSVGKNPRKGNPLKVARPPLDVAELMVEKGDDRLPSLNGLSQCPFFDRDGRLVSRPGHDVETGVFVDCNVEPIWPTGGIEEAIRLIEKVLLKDFPFHQPSDRTHAWAFLLLPFVRRMIDGPTPLHFVEAPSAGTGKGMLVEVCSLVSSGRFVRTSTLSEKEEENRKRITSMLVEGWPMIAIDNVTEALMSPALASSITSHIWGDRDLGKIKMLDIPNHAIWSATGNNALMHEDFPRRIVRIRLDARMEKPWDRKDLPDILTYARRERARLMGALICCVEYWIHKGRPLFSRRSGKGSFEGWRDLMGGILETIERPHFLASDGEYYDPGLTSIEWQRMVLEWHKAFGENWTTSGHIISLIEQQELLPSILGEKNRLQKAIALSKLVRAQRGRVIEGMVMQHESNPRKRQCEYRLAKPDTIE